VKADNRSGIPDIVNFPYEKFFELTGEKVEFRGKMLRMARCKVCKTVKALAGIRGHIFYKHIETGEIHA